MAHEMGKDSLLKDWIDPVWGKLQTKMDRMVLDLKSKSPHMTVDGIYDDMRLDWWTSGFWPGMLWIMYDLTHKELYRNAAWDWDGRIEQCFMGENNFHHDVGFQFLPTAVIKYKITGDMEAKRRALLAATFLAGRFNLAGNFIRAWNQDKTGWSIIDTMMNLSLLFWAAAEFNDPRFKHIAKAHADTVNRYFIREDGSVHHILNFDPEDGQLVEALGGQGYGPDSAWSRGQAWAIYGMANTYRYTGEQKYLQAAERVAKVYLAALPEDKVPYWDFRLPTFEGEPRDSSSASCAASGLLEISRHVSQTEAKFYRESAEQIIRSLSENYAMWDQPEYQGILRAATGNKPKNAAIDVSLIYGDYYYLECLAKLRGWDKHIF